MTTVRAEDPDPSRGVRLLTLDRPPANAIDAGLLSDLSAALDAAAADQSVRAVVITGAGRFFSGGLDIRAADFAEEFRSGRLLSLYRDSHLKLLAFPKPTVAMVNGHAIAGGLILLLACDLRLGLDADYRIGLNEVAIGASFPRAAFEIARLRLTHGQASELLLGAALYPAGEAVRLGVLDELLPAGGFEATVLERAARLGAFPREAYAHTKAALVAPAVGRIEAETAEEAARAAAVWMTAESAAARAAQQRKLEGR
ncbi:MAG TPA: enoyl-CoA hydratase/isomerase family protein [Dehalococcoidia bacterium]|nr:enoyl-CoA hydratase/isomerase family protein [Dehalococcoidia bacterium]